MPASRANGTPGNRDARPRPATPTDVSAAIAERRRREARRRHLTTGLVAGLLVLALLLVWLVRFSPVFAVHAVKVEGNRQVAEQQVVQAAQVPLGQPLVGLDEQAIADRVVHQLVPVARVAIDTQLPGTVVIKVSERTAVYQRKAGSQFQLVDASGVIFAVHSAPTKGLVSAITSNVDNRVLSAVATVVAALPPQVASRVSAVQADSPDKVVLHLDKGQQVLWGSAETSDVKAKVLLVLLTQKATIFDVSSPASPSTR